MNNAILQSLKEEVELDTTPYLRQKEQELAKIVEALEAVASSAYWKTLEKYIFSGLSESLYKKLQNEKDEKEIYRLQGQLVLAEKYADISKLVGIYKLELKKVRNQINGKNKINS